MPTEPKHIAGHIFEGAGSDRRCTRLKSDGTICGKYYDDIKHVTHEHVGKMGLAHVDNLTSNEVSEVHEENARLDRCFGAMGRKS